MTAETRQEPTRILIVDDDPDVNEFLVWVFVSNDYQVANAHNGQEALDVLARDNFDVILLDLVMPGTGGMAVIEELRENGVPLPIVVLSGHVGCLDAGRIRRLGVAEVLCKPAKAGDVLSAVGRAVRATVS